MSGGGKKPPANESGWGDPKDLERAVREAREAREAARTWQGPADPLADRGEAEAAGEIEAAGPGEAAGEIGAAEPGGWGEDDSPASGEAGASAESEAADAPAGSNAAGAFAASENADASVSSEAAGASAGSETAEAPAASEAADAPAASEAASSDADSPGPGEGAAAADTGAPPATWGDSDEAPAGWGEDDDPPATWGDGDETPTDWGDDDGPLPPPASLDEAVGLEGAAPPRKRRLGRRQLLALVGGGLFLLVAGSVGVASWLNSRHYYLVCGSQAITAERGSTWPWGRDALTGDRYRPIPIPANYECVSRELDSQSALDDAFLAALIERASALLTSGDPAAVAEAQAELQQALYLSRDPSRRETRELVERLQGDVEYWQAAAEIQAALDQLEKAAERFEAAAAHRPRHNGDATAWADHARAMGEEIRQGPPALRADTPPASPDGRPHFAGTGDDSPLEALADATATAPGAAEATEAGPAATESGNSEADPAAGEPGDPEAAEASGEPGDPEAAEADPAATAPGAPEAAEPTPPPGAAEPDAGLPRGGVLL